MPDGVPGSVVSGPITVAGPDRVPRATAVPGVMAGPGPGSDTVSGAITVPGTLTGPRTFVGIESLDNTTTTNVTLKKTNPYWLVLDVDNHTSPLIHSSTPLLTSPSCRKSLGQR